MGKQAASTEPQPPAQSANPAPNVSTPASEKNPVQAGESAPKPTAKKKTDGSHPASVANEPHPHVPAHQVAPTTGTAKEPELKQADQDKKEKKSRVATDKKSTKKPPAEDVFLSPVPLPSKPAAIGGSGG
jgi:hypothetical protein